MIRDRPSESSQRCTTRHREPGTLDASRSRSYVQGMSAGDRALPKPDGDWWPVDSHGPVSIGAHLVGDRWTLLVVRELLDGATRFNDIHSGLPGLSRSLLASRLRRLERLGLVHRVPLDVGGKYVEYRLTPAGAGLSGVIQALGAWTRDWQLQPAGDEGPDGPTMLWRVYRSLDASALPSAGISIEFRFVGGVPSRGWIRADRRRLRAGLGNPGGNVDLVVTAAPRVFDDLSSGVRQCDPAIEAGDMIFDGPAGLAAQLPTLVRAPAAARAVPHVLRGPASNWRSTRQVPGWRPALRGDVGRGRPARQGPRWGT